MCEIEFTPEELEIIQTTTSAQSLLSQAASLEEEATQQAVTVGVSVADAAGKYPEV